MSTKFKSRYKVNKARAIFRNTEESETDQSQAASTDINVIVRRHAVAGQVEGGAHAPMYHDFSQLPQDLRGMIEQTRRIEHLRKQLPAQLREKPLEELLNLTHDQLTAILTPPATTPAPPAPPVTP